MIEWDAPEEAQGKRLDVALAAHPEIGSIGLSESQAREKYGSDNIKIYKSEFTAMYYAMLEKKGPTAYKLICAGEEERVVGMHIIGMGSAEILQGFGVAIKMGATKANFGNHLSLSVSVCCFGRGCLFVGVGS